MWVIILEQVSVSKTGPCGMEATLPHCPGSCCHLGRRLWGRLPMCWACTWGKDRPLKHPRNAQCRLHVFRKKDGYKIFKAKGIINFKHQFLISYMQNHYRILIEHFSLLFTWLWWKGKNPAVLSKHILNPVQVPTGCEGCFIKATNK